MTYFSRIAFVVITLVASTACSVNRRTEDFACANDTECAPDRRCDTALGYCVIGTPIDASIDAISDGNGCPTACNSGCDLTARTCDITCIGSNCSDVTCPPGYDCTINCSQNACDSVTCIGDSECTINCVGNNACGNVDCGNGACKVVCNGNNACNNVDCNDAPCDVTCNGPNACNEVDCDGSCGCDVACIVGTTCDAALCLAPQCESPTGGCSSTLAGCPNTCP